jgi:hypothetical protein
MSLRTRKHDGRATARAGATIARGRARRATKQVTPLARSARLTAKRGVYGARVWAAPRVERTGNALQDRVAPKVSAMLVATARRMEPAQPIRRRRWPKIMAGILMLAVGSAAAAVLRSRRGPGLISKPDVSGQPMKAPSGPSSGHQMADAETADVNGQVRTP